MSRTNMLGMKRSLVLDIGFLCGEKPMVPEDEKEDVGTNWQGVEGTFCPLCLKNFSSKGNLRVHYSVVHRATKDFNCKMCDKRFGTKNNMQRHIDMVHRRERPYECSMCTRRFPTKSCVKRHEHTHRNDEGGRALRRDYGRVKL